MRKQFFGVLGAGLLGLAPLSALAAPMVSFGIADPDIQVGETFTVDVVVDGVDLTDEVLSFGFDVEIDPSWSESAPPEVGPNFTDDSALISDTDVAGSVFPGPGPAGDGILLATLSFVSSVDGLFELAIVSDLSTLTEGLFTLNVSNPLDLTHSEQVSIRAPVITTPEPPP